MDKVVKQKEDIMQLIRCLQDEANRLPETNAWGQSNDQSRTELMEWVAELQSAYHGNPVVNENSEMWYWLIGKNDSFGKARGI